MGVRYGALVKCDGDFEVDRVSYDESSMGNEVNG